MKKVFTRFLAVFCAVCLCIPVRADDIPQTITLDNQVVHLSDPRIYNRVYPWVNFYLQFPQFTAQCLANAKATFRQERFVFQAELLPDFVLYNKAVESCGNPAARSSAGAIGAWQIMPGTGADPRFGGYTMRDLYDPLKNADASAKYHRFLYSTFGDWLLVFGAYNTGEGNINRAIDRARSRNFWDLQLHPETMDHVPKILALMAIDQSGLLGDIQAGAPLQFAYVPSFTLPADARPHPRSGAVWRVKLRIKAPYVTIDYLAQWGGIPTSELIRANPHFNLVRFSEFKLPQKELEVLVPLHLKDQFVANISRSLGHALEVVP